MQHSAGDRRAGGAQRREPQSAGEPAGGGRERQRGAGEERHRPPITGEDRAGAERGTGTGSPVRKVLCVPILICCELCSVFKSIPSVSWPTT